MCCTGENPANKATQCGRTDRVLGPVFSLAFVKGFWAVPGQNSCVFSPQTQHLYSRYITRSTGECRCIPRAPQRSPTPPFPLLGSSRFTSRFPPPQYTIDLQRQPSVLFNIASVIEVERRDLLGVGRQHGGKNGDGRGECRWQSLPPPRSLSSQQLLVFLSNVNPLKKLVAVYTRADAQQQVRPR
jgi:hypothetical protein